MSLREQAIETSAALAARQKEQAKQQSHEKGRSIRDDLALWFGGEHEVTYEGWVTVDRPHESSGQAFYAPRIIHESVKLFRYTVGGDVVLGAEVTYRHGTTTDVWVETTCRTCGERTYHGKMGYSDGHRPWGLAFDAPHGWNHGTKNTAFDEDYFRTKSLPEFITGIGATLRADVVCAACMLAVPKHCPTCDRDLRS